MTVRPKEGAKGWLSMIGEHPYGPPEICYIDDSDRTDAPGIIEMAYGKGKSVYIPFAVGNFYAKEGHKNSLSLMQDVLFGICGIEEIAPDLSPMVGTGSLQDREGEDHTAHQRERLHGEALYGASSGL